MKKKFLTRTAAALLSALLVFSCTLSRPAALNARAASLALDGAALDEMSMVLWNLLMNALVACGVSSAVSDGEADSGTISTPIGSYDVEAALYEALLDSYEISSVNDMVFTLQNGRVVTLEELLQMTRWDTAGTGARQIPSEETWQRFRVIQGGSSGSPDKDPQFTQLASFVMDAGILLGISKFVEALQAGEVEGLEAADYFPEGFDGTLPQNADGKYILQGYTAFVQNGDYRHYDICASDFKGSMFISSVPVVGYLDYRNSVKCVFFGSINNANELIPVNVPCHVVSSAGSDYFFLDTYFFLLDGIYSFNIPVFSSRAAAELFLKTGDFSGCENALQYDPAALPDALPDNFAPLTGKELDPSVFNALFPALVSALQTAFPQPQPNPDPDAEPEPLPDPVAGTATFNKTVADTVAEAAPEAVPKPDPGPQPDIDAGSYKVNLTNVFPFCLPFDFIRLLDALDAEPVTPVFEFPFVVPALGIDMTVTLDMSFLEPAMEVFRMGETICFVILLIVLTQRVIKW